MRDSDGEGNFIMFTIFMRMGSVIKKIYQIDITDSCYSPS